jgi:hypothetical protein
MGYVFIPHIITELNTHLKTAVGEEFSLDSLFHRTLFKLVSNVPLAGVL